MNTIKVIMISFFLISCSDSRENDAIYLYDNAKKTFSLARQKQDNFKDKLLLYNKVKDDIDKIRDEYKGTKIEISDKFDLFENLNKEAIKEVDIIIGKHNVKRSFGGKSARKSMSELVF